MKITHYVSLAVVTMLALPTIAFGAAQMSVKTLDNPTRQYVVTPGEKVDFEFQIVNSGDVEGLGRLEILAADIKSDVSIDESTLEGVETVEDFDFALLPTFSIDATNSDRDLALWANVKKDQYKVEPNSMKTVKVSFEIPEDLPLYSVYGGQVLVTQMSMDDEDDQSMGSSVSTAVGKNLQFYVLPTEKVSLVRDVEKEAKKNSEASKETSGDMSYYLVLGVLALLVLVYMFYPTKK